MKKEKTMEYAIYINDGLASKKYLMNAGKDFSWTSNASKAYRFESNTAAERFHAVYMANFNGLTINTTVVIRGVNIPFCITDRDRFGYFRHFFSRFDESGNPIWAQELDDARLFHTFTEALRFMYEIADKLTDDMSNIQIESLGVIRDCVLCGDDE